MVSRIRGSKMGEGTGGASHVTSDPNNPSFDASTHANKTTEKLSALCDNAVFNRLSDWEKSFVLDVYGKAPLTRKQHITVSRLHDKYVI